MEVCLFIHCIWLLHTFFFIAVKVHQCESELWGKQGGCLASFKRKNQPDEHYMASSSSKQVRDDGSAPASYTHLRPGVCVYLALQLALLSQSQVLWSVGHDGE